MPELTAQRGYELRSRLHDQELSLDELRREVDYLEKRLDRMEKNTRRRFYNEERPHSALDYQTPAAYTANYETPQTSNLVPILS